MPDLLFQFAFDRPWFLLLLLLLPLLWWLSFNSLAGLGRTRRAAALIFRSLLVIVLVFALAEAKWQYKTCLLYTSPSPRDATLSRMPSSA